MLSHNDLNPTNLIYDGAGVQLLDWSAAGPLDPLYDLATLAMFLRSLRIIGLLIPWGLSAVLITQMLRRAWHSRAATWGKHLSQLPKTLSKL